MLTWVCDWGLVWFVAGHVAFVFAVVACMFVMTYVCLLKPALWKWFLPQFHFVLTMAGLLLL